MMRFAFLAVAFVCGFGLQTSGDFTQFGIGIAELLDFIFGNNQLLLIQRYAGV